MSISESSAKPQVPATGSYSVKEGAYEDWTSSEGLIFERMTPLTAVPGIPSLR